MSAGGVAEVRFVDGLPGFPAAQRFRLTPWGGDASPFLLLEDAEDAELAFIAVDPTVFFPDYDPPLAGDARERLALGDGDDAVVLVLVTAPGAPEDATANLLGPLVLNPRTGEGEQVVLDDARWGARVPLLQEASR